MKNLYIGGIQRAKENWSQILGEPKKPGNWKEETYQQKKAELQEKQAKEAPRHLAAGYPSTLSVVDDKQQFFTGHADAVLLHINNQVLIDKDTYGEHSCVNIIGIDTLDLLRQAAWSFSSNTEIPIWIWNASGNYNRYVHIINLHTCSGASGDSAISVRDFITYWLHEDRVMAGHSVQVDIPAYDIPDHTVAANDAAVVYRIAKRMGF